MSSIITLCMNVVDRLLGDGNIESKQQGFVIILIDKVVETIAKVLKS